MPHLTPTAPQDSIRQVSLLRRLGLTVAAVAVLTGTALSAAPPARADVGTAGYLCVDNDPRGAGCFNPDGDHVRVHDNRTDGWRILVRTVTSYGREDVCAIPTGKATTHCNYNMAEGREVQVNVVAVNTVDGDKELIGQDTFQI